MPGIADEAIGHFRSIVGDTQVLVGEDARSRPDNYTLQSPTAAMCIVRPKDAAEVSAVLSWCNARGINVVAHGGRTGLAGGTGTAPGDVVVSLERMTAIAPVDVAGGTVTVGAGATLQSVQEAARAAGYFYPVDIGARGSATIGGNISTNAGGNSVLRYGMTRQQVLGLEVVLADGRILSSLNRLVKNNAGYDLKQMFIGSEGTLGIVTRAVLRLQPEPGPTATAFVGLSSFDQVLRFLEIAATAAGGALTSFEVMWSSFVEVIFSKAQHVLPTAGKHPYYVLLDIAARNSVELLEAALVAGFEASLLSDAVVAQNTAQAEAFWAIRDDIDALAAGLKPVFPYDISMPQQNMEEYVTRLDAALTARWPAARTAVGGHVADSNIHVCVSTGALADHAEVDAIVYGLLERYRDSVSAEHGIGTEKRAWLGVSRSDGEIALMQELKRLLDPNGILNRGKVLAAATAARGGRALRPRGGR